MTTQDPAYTIPGVTYGGLYPETVKSANMVSVLPVDSEVRTYTRKEY